MPEGPIGVQEINNREHIDPLKTGDNIAAKRVASYNFDPVSGQWSRLSVPSGLIQANFDYITLTQASTTDTWTFKSGGSGGTTVGTITITYTDSTKATISTVART